MTPTEKARVFRDAARLIEREGFNRHGYRRGYATGDPIPPDEPDGPCCLLGALGRVTDGRFDAADDLHLLLIDELAHDFRVHTGILTSVVDYNDDPSTTAEAVVTALRGCATAIQSLGRESAER